MRFLVDAQLPPALAKWLSTQGYRAEHVIDLGMEAAADRAIWQRAEREGAVIVTKDEDFAIWHIAHDGANPQVIWLRIGNTRRSELLERIEQLMPRLIEALQRGESLIEIR